MARLRKPPDAEPNRRHHGVGKGFHQVESKSHILEEPLNMVDLCEEGVAVPVPNHDIVQIGE